MSLATQHLFARALLDADRALPDGLTSWNRARSERRFAVYRNNVAAGLIGALATRFPVTEKIVGEAFFAGMAQAFIAEHPPRSALLLGYGDDLAEFVEAFGPAAELAYLPDVIRLEAARSRAYHAADRLPLEPSTLEGLNGDVLAALRFVFLTVGIQRLPPGGARFLTALMSGEALAAAAELALGAEPKFDLAANLAGALQSGALTAIA